MGVLVCMALGFGAQLILSAPRRVVTIYDFTNCYSTPVVLPCERVAYRGGGLNVVFTIMCGVLLIAVRRVAPVGALGGGEAEADHRRLPEAAR